MNSRPGSCWGGLGRVGRTVGPRSKAASSPFQLNFQRLGGKEFCRCLPRKKRGQSVILGAFIFSFFRPSDRPRARQEREEETFFPSLLQPMDDDPIEGADGRAYMRAQMAKKGNAMRGTRAKGSI